MNSSCPIVYLAHNLPIGDTKSRWLALTQLARLIPYFILFSLIAILFAIFVRFVRRCLRRARRRRFAAVNQAAEVVRLRRRLIVRARRA